MRVIALGGAGDMCGFAVRDLACCDEVTEIMIADLDADKASRLARELGTRCRSMRLDANVRSELVRAIDGYDVAIGGVGPFYKYELEVASGALAAGVDYVSICDDYDAAESVFSLDPEARAKGVTILTGLGFTPGLSNVLARKGADMLDEVETIAVTWAASASDSQGYAVILHLLHTFTGLVPSYRRGSTEMVQAASGAERVRFPDPVGEINVYHVGHPEPVTIPRYLKAADVTVKGGLSEGELNQVVKYLVKLHLTTSAWQKELLGKTVKLLAPVLFQLGKPSSPCSAIRLDISGKKGSSAKKFTYGAAGHMSALTGYPLAIGALMIGRGEIDAPGVQSPESCVDADSFLAELGKRGVVVYQGEDFAERIN